MNHEEFYEQADDRILAIYPQQRYHSNAYIVGGRAGLTALRDAINEALDAEGRMGISVGLAMAHPSDQEVFSTVVIHDKSIDQAEESSRVHLDDMPLPYYDPKCKDQLRDGVVNLVPNERHVMEAGVAHYLLNEKLKKQDAEQDDLAQTEAHPT